MPRNVEENHWPFDVLDHEREQNGANPMRHAGTVVCLGHLASPVRDDNDRPPWMQDRRLHRDMTNEQASLVAHNRVEYAVKLDRDGSLWWFDNIVEKDALRSLSSSYRPYVHSAMDDYATNHIAMAKQITMTDPFGPLVHFPVGWKVSCVPMRPHHLRGDNEGNPLVLQKHVGEDLDMYWTLTLPDMTEGVACEIVQDLGVHQPNKEIQAGPVLSFRRHCPRLPTRVSAA